MKRILENWRRFVNINEAVDYTDHLQDGGKTFYVIDDRGKERGFTVALLQWGEKKEFYTFKPTEEDEYAQVKIDEKPMFKVLGYLNVTRFKPHRGGECYSAQETLMKPDYVQTALKGKGPILYDLALEYCKRKGYWFTPDIQQRISDSAQPVWHFYNTKRKNDLEILQFDRHRNPFITPEDLKDDCESSVYYNTTRGSEVEQDWLDSPFTKAYRMKSDNLIKHYEQYKVMRITQNRFPAGYLTSTRGFIWYNNQPMLPDEYIRTDEYKAKLEKIKNSKT